MQKRQATWQFIYFFIAAAIVLVFIFSPKAGIYDWDKEIFYTRTIRDSILEHGTLPYVLWNREPFTFYPVIGQTALFISYPETFLFSPLMPLSLWLSPAAFLKAITLIHFAIGCLGAWMLGRQFGWEKNQTRLFSALFLLSPIILQHVAIGYLPWVTLYYFPWLLYFMVHEKQFARVAGMGMVLAATLLNGGAHTAFWFGLFIAVTCTWILIRDRYRWTLAVDAILAAAASALLGFARVYSSFMAFGNFSQDFFAGYSLKAFLRMTLIPPMFFIKDIDHVEGLIEGYIDGVPYWDGGIYWGTTLVVVLLILFMLAAKKIRNQPIKNKDVRLPMFLTSATFLVLSLGSSYASLAGIASRITGIGALTGIEKYPFRFAIMAYLGFSVFICDHYPDLLSELQHWGNWFVKTSTTAIYQIDRSLANQRRILKKVFKLMALLIVFLLLFNAFIKPAVLAGIHGFIQEAYEGTGSPVLARMMVNKETLPLTAYLEKGEALLDLIVRKVMLAFIITACGLAVLVFPRQLLAALHRITASLLKNRSAIVELVIALPLLFASLMWLRVAVSTPMESYATLSDVPILVKAITPADARMDVASRSPERIELLCHSPSAVTCQVVVDIPFMDSTWLQTVNIARVEDRDGSLGLVMPAGKRAFLYVDHRGFEPAVRIMIGSWLTAIVGLVLWNVRRHNSA